MMRSWAHIMMLYWDQNLQDLGTWVNLHFFTDLNRPEIPFPAVCWHQPDTSVPLCNWSFVLWCAPDIECQGEVHKVKSSALCFSDSYDQLNCLLISNSASQWIEILFQYLKYQYRNVVLTRPYCADMRLSVCTFLHASLRICASVVLCTSHGCGSN